jgi:serine/threonine protein kinase
VQNVRRELEVLRLLHHANVIVPKEIIQHAKSASIVMEPMAMDVFTLVERSASLLHEGAVKCLALQLFEGLRYLHDDLRVMHRVRMCSSARWS